MIWVSTISSCLSDRGIGAGKCPNGHVVSREPPTVILDAMDRVCTEDGKATKKLDLRCYRLAKASNLQNSKRTRVTKAVPLSVARVRVYAAAAGEIVPHTDARLRQPAPAGCRHRHARRHRRIRRQCAGRHPRRSISAAFAATPTGMFASDAIFSVN